tara:strand:- start:301 stop:582 length:282 start_codon:yes stop_codon:yes gene_type:complete
MDNKLPKIGGMVNITQEMRDMEAMKDWQIVKNEQWFKGIFSTLNENGKWVWIDNPEYTFIKKGDKILCCKEGYNAVSLIVTPNFLKEKFYYES